MQEYLGSVSHKSRDDLQVDLQNQTSSTRSIWKGTFSTITSLLELWVSLFQSRWAKDAQSDISTKTVFIHLHVQHGHTRLWQF